MDDRVRQIRERLAKAAIPAERKLDSLRDELASNPDAVRKAIAAEMRRCGSFRTRKRRPDDMGPMRAEREGNRHALNIHNAKAGNILRERFPDAIQNAIGHLCVMLAEPDADSKHSTGGAISIAAHRCLEPFHEREPESPVVESFVERISRLKATGTVRRSWDSIDYAAAREGLAVRFTSRIDRQKQTAVVSQWAEFVETFLSELPALPDTLAKGRTLQRRHVATWFYCGDRRPMRTPKQRPERIDTWAERRIENHFAYGWGI